MLDRNMIPDAVAYFASRNLRLIGRGRQRQGACPVHGGSDSLSIDVERGIFFCHACGAKGGDMLDLHSQAYGLSLKDAARELGAWTDGALPAGAMAPCTPRPQAMAKPDREPALDVARMLWDERQPLANSVGTEYLRARRCAIPPADGDLAFHPALRHPCGYIGPGLLACITDALTGAPMGVHRTWITATGKVDVPKAKLTLGPKRGGVIRLWPDESVTTGVAIAEGIETALSIANHYRPVWCVIDAGNMTALPVLRGIECLVIGADNDESGIGMRAAKACADRWAQSGVSALIIPPEAEGSDWNDVEVAK